MPGMIPSEDLPGLYAAASLLIYPSLYEGFGLPPVEAAAVGTPVLAADNSSLPEVVPKRKCRFDSTDPTELIALLRQAAVDPSAFISPLLPEFTEAKAMSLYREILGQFS